MDDIRPAIPAKSNHFLAALGSNRQGLNDACPPNVHAYVPDRHTPWAIYPVDG